MSRLLCFLAVVALQACASVPPTRQLNDVSRAPTADTPAVAATPDDEPEPPDDDIMDVDESEGDPNEVPPPVELPPHPFAELSDEELEARLLNDPDSLGPLSIGRPGAGALMGGVPMPTSERWNVVNPRETWGTQETVDFLARCIDAVNEQFPDTPKIPIGDISTRSGGHLVPHVSHQSGRDVDVAFYYRGGENWYTRANANNLDFPRTWAFIRAMITETDVSLIFIDRSIQKLLREYAQSIGEDEGWLDEVFGGPSTPMRSIIRHEEGHDTHIHVRFYNPIAQESGRRVYRMLTAHKMIKPPTYYISYKVRRGDTLNKIARKYKTTVTALKKTNRLRSNRIIAGRSYKIPRRGGVAPPPGPIAIPARRMPPHGPVPPTQVADTDELQSSASGGASQDDSADGSHSLMNGRSPAIQTTP